MNAARADQAYEPSSAITAEGHRRLRSQLVTLRGRRRMLHDGLRDARDDGDVGENTAFLELIEEQANLERRIATLEAQLAAAHVVSPPADGIAGVGTCVRVRELEGGEIVDYQLVGSLEADVGSNRISISSPVGRVLVGSRPGKVVEADTPRGRLAFEILDVWSGGEPSPLRQKAA
jgi:transcription elongation factor GreA